MRTLVRFEYDIENVKLFDIVDGGAVHGAFNGNLTIYFDMSEDGKLLDESKQALRLEARRICRAQEPGDECYRVHPERRYEGRIWPRVCGAP